MPASQPAGREGNSDDKTQTVTLLFGQLGAASVGDSVFAFFDALDEATLDEIAELLLDPRRGLVEIERDNRRTLDRQNLRLAQPLQDAILRFSHPVGAVPDAHRWPPIRVRGLSWYRNLSYTGNQLNCTGNTTKWIASRHGCNDRPGALRSRSLRAGDRRPRPGGRWNTTMKSDNADGLQSRPSTDALAVIERADRAYHDPAQFHLHEFGGGGA